MLVQFYTFLTITEWGFFVPKIIKVDVTAYLANCKASNILEVIIISYNQV